MATKEELKELRGFLKEEPSLQMKKANLIFDGKQYSLRFPKKFIEEAEIDMEEDLFEIKLIIPHPSHDEKPKLSVELIRK